MKVAAGILTYNPLANKRKKLLQQTVDSLADADEVVVFDNGSTDVYNIDAEVVQFPRLKGFPHGNTCGYGMNKVAATLKADIVILSNDDIVWKPDAVQTLKEVWAAADDKLTIISGLVEGTYQLPGMEPWNKPYGTVNIAGHNLLLRKSVPGGAWTYRGGHYDRIFPVSTFPGVDDVPACHKLIGSGYPVACMDLAVHEGVVSTWGNGSEQYLTHTREQVFEEYAV